MTQAQDTADRSSDQHATSKTVMVATVAAIGGFLFGFDTAVINGAVDAIQSEFELSSFMIGFTVAVALLGSAVGAWFAGPAADRIGRVRVMVIAAALFAVSALGSGFAFTEWDLILWRFVGGVGVGVASVIAPAYIAEIAPAYLRGRLGSLQQLAIVLGIFAALLLDAAIAGAAGGAEDDFWFGLAAWRWMFLSELLPAAIYGVLVLNIPESPRYLVAKGELRQAAVVVREVLGLTRDEAASRKVEDIRRSLRREDKPSLRDLRGGSLGLLPVVWIGILLSVFQQFVGINVIFYYSTSLWQSIGFSEDDSFTFSVITSIVNVLVTLIAIALVDKVGRKPLLLVGSAGMFLCLCTMALCFTQASIVDGEPRIEEPFGVVALIAANLYVVFFGATWGPVVWVLLGEMFSNRIRAAALAVAAAAQWLANFTVSTTFPPLAQDVSLAFAYLLYGIFAGISFFFVWRKVPETKGRELEDMDSLLEDQPRRGGGRRGRSSDSGGDSSRDRTVDLTTAEREASPRRPGGREG